MKLKKFKERDSKKIGVIVFTLVCLFLISGAVLYRTFAIFEVKTNQNVIEGKVGDMGDLRFMVYINGELQKDMPNKDSEYSLDTSKSYCEDITDSSKRSHISWNQEKWSIEIKDISTTKTKCYLYFDKLYVDSTLNGENGSVGPIPDLGNELVAITFDETGHAKKADLTKEWYNYGKQKWANAVILKSKQDYAVDEVIPEENIESYFVWIPRYRYQIWNGVIETSKFNEVTKLGNIEDATKQEELNKAQKIEIKFETKNDAVKKGINKGEWLTHPAFLSFDSNGMWVGKFETSKSTNDADDSISPEAVQIKPGVSSWREIRVANAFYTTYNYKRELESHMMKNMEWGAVAYLTNSKYGRCPNGTCSEVRINNNSDYITGSSAVTAPTCGYTSWETVLKNCHIGGTASDIVNLYNNSASVEASTTGNYYGIFDMSGGAWEMIMGVMLDQDGKPASGRNNDYNSNFVGILTYPSSGMDSSKTEWTTSDGGLPWPDSRYYDTYAYDLTAEHFQRGLLGDGTKEFGPFYQVSYNGNTGVRRISEWNADDGSFVNHGDPWFIRGGNYYHGTNAGLSSFIGDYGRAQGGFGFRVVLTP